MIECGRSEKLYSKYLIATGTKLNEGNDDSYYFLRNNLYSAIKVFNLKTNKRIFIPCLYISGKVFL